MTPFEGSLELFLCALPAAAVSDSRGVVVCANARFAELFGYAPSELAGMPLRAFIPGCAPAPAGADAAPDAWLSMQGLRQDGAPLAVEVSASPVRAGRRRYTVSIVRAKHQDWVKSALGAIAEGLTTWADENFFRALVSGMARRLGVRYALVGELIPGTTRVATLAVWSDGDFADNFEFEMAGTPCAGIMTSRICAYERGVQQQFPDDDRARQLKLESFVAVPLRDADGTRQGLLAIADTGPLTVTRDLSVLMLLLAGRAGAALAQRRQVEALRVRARLLDAAGQAIVAVDAQGFVTHWNRAAESLFGWTSSDVIGKHVMTLVPSSRTGQYSDEIARVLLGSESWSGEFTLPHRDDSEVRGYGTVVPLHDADGRFEGIVAVSTDFREVRAARAALEDEHRLLTSVIESTADSIFAKDREGRYMLANSTFAKAVGMPVSEILGRSAADLVDADAALKGEEADRAVMEAGSVSVVEARVTVRGEERWLRTTKAPLRDERGELRGVVGVARDITRAKAAEQELRDSEEMARDVMNSMVSHIAVVDPAGEIIAVNDGWRRFGAANAAGQRTIDGVGVNYLEVCRRAAANGVAAAAAALFGLEDVLAGRSVGFRMEYDCHSPEEQRWFTLWATPLASGRLGVLITHLDITAQRSNEERWARLRAEEVSESFRRDLLRMVSHELRTPLSVIHGYLSVMLEYEGRIPADEVRSMITEADASARRLNELIENVLTMSRLDYGMLVLDLRRVPLDELLQDAVAAARPFTGDRRVNVTLPPEPVLVTADLIWIRQTLLNLLDNARKYAGPESPIDVRAELLDDERVTVSVCDHGPGVPLGSLAAIFEPFERHRDPSNGHARGFGLGLAICKGIVETHGERIWGSMAEGGGLCVSFTLKRAEPDGGGASAGMA